MVARCEETSAVHGSGEPVKTKLHRIAEKARKEPGFKFTSLYHLMNEELLRGCFKRLRKDAAAGIDKMTKDMYAENLEANLSNLIDRLHRMAYIPQPVRRKYIPKPGSANYVLWGYRVLRINLFRRDWSGYWNQCTSRTS
jgi:retron-type reverse transcriptase